VPLWLIGMMGAGKTTVGLLLAERTGTRFLDTDAMVESEAGMPISEIFSREGEKGFRKRESAAVRQASADERGVVATGGGAVLSAANVRAMRNSGSVVWLNAAPATLSERIGDPAGRPLLEGDDLRARLAVMLEDRRSAYESAAHHVVVTDDASPEEVALLVGEIWNAS
jgi:shikimate kinase